MPDGSEQSVGVFEPQHVSSHSLVGAIHDESRQQQRRILTRNEVARRIAIGETLVLHNRRVYKLDAWLARHPGGELAILHFVGRDATDEIEAYHCDATLRKMKGFIIGSLDERDWEGDDGEGYKPLVPPIQLGYRSGKLDHPDAQWKQWEKSVQRAKAALPDVGIDENVEARLSTRPQGFPLPLSMLEPPAHIVGIEPKREQAISKAYRRLHDEVKAAGMYELRPIGYAQEVSRYLALAAVAFALWSHSHYLLSSFFLGLFWHQLTFTAHDAGHSGITHNHSIDRSIGTLIADVLGGLSIGWWCDNHDIHHLVTNHPEHDPDIQHMPFLAVNPSFLVKTSPSGHDQQSSFGLWSSYYRRVLTFDAPARLFLKYQHKIYYVLMSFGRFNLYAQSYTFLSKAKRDKWWLLEIAGVVFFWYWFAYIYLGSMESWKSTIGALLISHIVTSPLHIQVSLT